MNAFYTRQGTTYTPTGLGLSPWNNRSQSGVAMGGLVATALEAGTPADGLATTRVTIDILGTVPMEPLTAHVVPLRQGRRIGLVELTLVGAERTWIRATALRARVDESPPLETAPIHPFPDDDTVPEKASWFDSVRIAGDPAQRGRGAMWARLTAAVVAGQPLTPFERLGMASDFGSGTAPAMPFAEWTLANLDISLVMTRLPRGEWLLIDAASETAGNGLGIASARIGDREGMMGRTLQTIFLDRR